MLPKIYLFRGRYRDLIDAADTITEMKKTSEEVTDHLFVMEDKLNSLKHRQLLGFKTEVSTAEKHKYVMYLIVITMKVIFIQYCLLNPQRNHGS